MDLEKEQSTISTRKTRVRKSFRYILEAVQELDEGKIEFRDFVEKHGIHRCTINSWRKQIERNKGLRRTRVYLPKETIMKVVREIVSGEITINEVVEKYNLGCNKTVQHWLEKYSCEIGVYTSQDMGTRKKKDLTDVEKQKIDLEKALKDANLKIMALETLINVAEKELKIDIRKKPGTKQS